MAAWWGKKAKDMHKSCSNRTTMPFDKIAYGEDRGAARVLEEISQIGYPAKVIAAATKIAKETEDA